MWLGARTSCLPVWARPPPPSHRSRPRGMGGGGGQQADVAPLLPAEKGSEQAALPAGARPPQPALAVGFMGSVNVTMRGNTLRARPRCCTGVTAPRSKEMLKASQAMQQCARWEGTPRHAVPPSRHGKQGVPLAPGTHRCHLKSGTGCSAGHQQSFCARSARVGSASRVSPLGSEHPHCRGDIDAQ